MDGQCTDILTPEQFMLQPQRWRWQGFALCRATFQRAANVPALAAQSGIVLPAGIGQAVSKRQSEYLAGRMLVRHLQQELGLACDQVLPAADRSPQWPAGQSGAISHSGGEVLVGLCARPEYSLGLDLEHYLEPAQLMGLRPFIASTAEQQWLVQQARSGHWSEAQLLTLLFAAKEALYKALYPDCRRIMEFSAAEVREISATQLSLVLCTDWSAGWRCGSEITLEYQCEATLVQVLTSVRRRPSQR